MESGKRVNLITIFIYIVYLASAVWFIKNKQMFKIGIVLFCVISTFTLSILNKKNNKLVDNSIYINLIIFILVSSLFGTCFNFYSINYYDDFLHLYSGILACNVAYLIIKYFNSKDNMKDMNKLFVIIFLFMFSMGVASLWEIMEFSIDNLFGMHTQIGGLNDTMIDMIDGLVGTIISMPFFLKSLKKLRS